MHPAVVHPVRAAGSTLVDVMFAISMVAFACAALFLLYSNSLQLLQNQQSTQAATLCLQERTEKLRMSNWAALTDPTALLTLLGTVPPSASWLPGLTEEITVNPYPLPATLKPLHVRRNANGTGTVLTTNTTLLASTLLRVDIRATWQGRGRSHIRENSILVAPGGMVE